MNEGPILLCALAMCGCAGPRPAPPSTATVVAPASWRNDSDAADTLDGRWWWAFGDPSLAAVVEGALANNTDIAIAVTRVEEAPNCTLTAASHDRGRG
jgi:outer membrane protein TolC